MSEMVERVAIVLSERDIYHGWHNVPDATKELYRDQARGAIEAMREPTEAMICAAENGVPMYRGTRTFLKAWNDMIDEALK